MTGSVSRLFAVCVLFPVFLAAGCQRAEKLDPFIINQGTIVGRVSLSDDSEPVGVSVVAIMRDNDAIRGESNSAIDGTYRIENLAAGIYDLTATKTGYRPERAIATVEKGKETTVDMVLDWIPTDVPASIVYVSGGSNNGDPDQEAIVGQRLSEPFVVEVRDAGGQALSDVQVVFQIVDDQDGGDMETSGWMSTDTDGRVRNYYFLGHRAGQNKVRVQALGLQDEHVDFSPVGIADSPARITVESGADQSAVVGQVLPVPISIQVTDTFGNPADSVVVDFIPSSDGGAQPSKASTDAQGRTQTTWTLGTAMALDPDFQVLSVSAGDAQTQVFAQADHDSATEIIAAGGDNQSTLSGQEFSAPLVARVLDKFGNPVDQVEVLFQVTDGNCTFNPSTPPALISDADGQVSTYVTPVTAGGLIIVQALVTGMAPAEFHLTVVSGQPGSILADDGLGQSGNIGEQLPVPLRFRVLDGDDNPVSDAWVHFEPGATRGELGTVSEQNVKSDELGFASTYFTLGTAAGHGAQWVIASLTGFPAVTPASIDVNVFADDPELIQIMAGDQQSAGFGEALADPLGVLVTDQYENPVSGVSVSWSSSTGGSVTPNPSYTEENGGSSVLASLGSDAQLPVQYFTAQIESGASVTFTAYGSGHHIDQLVPASVPPGYPDPNDPDPASTSVPIEIIGGGFEQGAVVIWDSMGSPEDITPETITAGTIDFLISADHFSVGREGVYMVSVRNPDGTSCTPSPFTVTVAIPDSGQTPLQCTEYVFTGPGGWEWQRKDCSGFQPGEDYYGQDGHYHSEMNQPDLVVNGDGTVTDNLTQLMWTRCAAGQNQLSCSGNPTYINHDDAIIYCQDLDFAGYDDWSLPSVVEMIHVANYSIDNSVLDPVIFPNVPGEYFWTSDVYADDSSQAWRWSAQQGRTEAADASLADGVVRCVRNRQPDPAGRFVRSEPVSDEPVVFDSRYALMWQGCLSGERGLDCNLGGEITYTWVDALRYCEELTWAGMDDWRLPQIKEMVTILDLSNYWPAVNLSLFPNSTTGWQLSSTNLINSMYWSAPSIFVGEGIIGASFKDGSDFRVRCVRSDY